MLKTFYTCKECSRFRNVYIYYNEENHNCTQHDKSNFIYFKLPKEDFYHLLDISRELSFMESMANLYKEDIVEYNLKMSQFRVQAEQIRKQREEKQAKERTEKNAIKCPICRSTKVELGSRGWGLLTGMIGSGSPRHICRNCGWKWKVG